VEIPKRIKPWWFVSDSGKVCFSVRYGSWTIELAKGKPSVEVASAADLLARVTNKCKKLVEYVFKKYPNQDNVLRLHDGFNPKQIMETLPTSEHTAYSENKGEKIAFCLNKAKKDNNDMIDENTLTFVAIHELSHVATQSIGHKSEFWANFKFLLEEAKEAGIYSPKDYKSSPQEYCGMKITDNPYYDA
jgi:hypothetical protein